MKFNKIKQHMLSSKGDKKSTLVLKNANMINVLSEEIQICDIAIEDGIIVGIGNYQGDTEIDMTGKYVSPGLIDSHVHIESTMVCPEIFASEVLPHGTTTIIADPHEITNVMGLSGVEYILAHSEKIPLNVYVMLPSCVPCSSFETNGADFTCEDIKKMINHPRVIGLGEVMDYPSVLTCEESMMEKIHLIENGMIDGHAPNLSNLELQAYRLAGIKTDHESCTFESALEKIRAGIFVLIREGSAAKSIDNIVPGILKANLPTQNFAFCTDDKHISDIKLQGHILNNVRKSVKLGMNPIKAIQIASINAARIYNLKDIGSITAGLRADLVVFDDITNFTVRSVYKDGVCISNQGEKVHIPVKNLEQYKKNSVNIPHITKESLSLKVSKQATAIELVDYQVLTKKTVVTPNSCDGEFIADEKLSKLVVIERHKGTGNMAVAILKGYNIKNGAIACTVAHDSHNIICAGDNDADMVCAINELKNIKGGYIIVENGIIRGHISLEIAGLITENYKNQIDKKLDTMLETAYSMGIPKTIDPFLTLSFLSLCVLPQIRLTDKGLLDVATMQFI